MSPKYIKYYKFKKYRSVEIWALKNDNINVHLIYANHPLYKDDTTDMTEENLLNGWGTDITIMSEKNAFLYIL